MSLPDPKSLTQTERIHRIMELRQRVNSGYEPTREELHYGLRLIYAERAARGTPSMARGKTDTSAAIDPFL
jgi:hypothetical protein